MTFLMKKKFLAQNVATQFSLLNKRNLTPTFGLKLLCVRRWECVWLVGWFSLCLFLFVLFPCLLLLQSKYDIFSTTLSRRPSTVRNQTPTSALMSWCWQFRETPWYGTPPWRWPAAIHLGLEGATAMRCCGSTSGAKTRPARSLSPLTEGRLVSYLFHCWLLFLRYGEMRFWCLLGQQAA